MALGKPSISIPNAGDLRSLQTAIQNIRERFQALEAVVGTLSSTSIASASTNVSSTAINTLRNQIVQLQQQIDVLGLVTQINLLPFTSGALADMAVPVVLDGDTGLRVTAGDIAALADLGALITALSYSSGVYSAMQVPVEIDGVAYRINVGDIGASPDLGALIANAAYSSGVDAHAQVAIEIGGVAYRVNAGDIAALTSLLTLFTATPFSSGVNANALVPVEQNGTVTLVSAGDIAALAPSGITSVAASGGVQTTTGSPITGTGTIRGAAAINAQVGTTYAILATDRGKHITLSNAASIAVSIAQAGTTGFEDGFYSYVENVGVGAATITPTTSTINGATTLVLQSGVSAILFSDGANYRAFVFDAAGVPVNAQAGTTYTFLSGDRGKLVTFTNAAAIAGTLAQATGAFGAPWFVWLENRGAGTLTITPTTSTIDGAATLALTTNQGCLLVSDGANYFTACRGIASGAAGLVNIQETLSATATNTTVNIELLQVANGTTTVGLNLNPKGNAPFVIGPVPDGTTTGGNARTSSVNAFDIQRSRTAAAQVNKGVNAFMGGINNEIFNTNSSCDFLFSNTAYLQGTGGNVIIGGASHTIGPAGNFSASSCGIFAGSSFTLTSNPSNSGSLCATGTITAGAYRVMLGSGVTTLSGAAGNYNAVIACNNATLTSTGESNVFMGGLRLTTVNISGFYNTFKGISAGSITGSGSYNWVGGASHVLMTLGSYNIINGTAHSSTGDGNLVMGSTNTASGSYGQVTGVNANQRGSQGVHAHAYGQRAAAGDSQRREMTLRLTTTNATPTPLTANGVAASAISQMLMVSNSVLKIRGQVSVINRATMAVASFDYSATLKNNAGTVTVIGTPTVTQQAADAGVAATTITIVADNTNKCPALTATGIAATTLDWTADMFAVESA